MLNRFNDDRKISIICSIRKEGFPFNTNLERSKIEFDRFNSNYKKKIMLILHIL
jgi:hypothetical protein